MGFFTTRERADLDRSTQEVEAKVREFARREFAPRRRAPDNDLVAGNAGALLAQVTSASLKQIDALIIELQAHRQRLLSEGALVQRAILEYAKMSQSTMQSTRIIAESLSYWNRIPDAPKIADIADMGVAADVDIGREPAHRAEIDRELERSVAAALAQPVKDLPSDADPAATVFPDDAEHTATVLPDVADHTATVLPDNPEHAATVLADDAETIATVLPDDAEPAATVRPDDDAEGTPEPLAIAEAPSVVADRPDAETQKAT